MTFPCFAATSSDIAFEQAPVDEILICSVSVEIGANWRHLGAVLGLESALMNNIEKDHTECYERAWKVLEKWKERNGNGATVEILINALLKIGRKDAVQKLLGM